MASTATLSQRTASSGFCVVSTTVTPLSHSWRRRRITSVPWAGSSPIVGSSRKSCDGSASSSTAMAARLRWPASSSPTREAERPARSTARSASAAAPSSSPAPRSAAVYRSTRSSESAGWIVSPLGMYPACRPARADHPVERATVPEDGGRSPDIASSSVVFPDPLPPMIAISSP